MVEFTAREIVDTDDGKKVITVRRFRKNGTMPFKEGTVTYLKKGRNKKRYGQIQMIKAEVKSLNEMTEADAKNGGYESRNDYINDHLQKFNCGVDLNEKMIFYTYRVLWMDEMLVEELRKELGE